MGAARRLIALAGLLSAWFIPKPIKDQFLYFSFFVASGSLAISLLMYVVASRLGRGNVTPAERLARRLLFKRSE